MAGLTFAVSLGFSAPVQQALENLTIAIGVALVLAIIVTAVIADVIAVAATAATEAPFHAMASDRVPGSREAVWLTRHGARVNSFCADAIGDICGTVSGAIGAALSLRIAMGFPLLPIGPISMIVLGLIAALTVGSKAYTKAFAVRNSVRVLLWAGRCAFWARTAAGLVTAAGRRLRRTVAPGLPPKGARRGRFF